MKRKYLSFLILCIVCISDKKQEVFFKRRNRIEQIRESVFDMIKSIGPGFLFKKMEVNRKSIIVSEICNINQIYSIFEPKNQTENNEDEDQSPSLRINECIEKVNQFQSKKGQTKINKKVVEVKNNKKNNNLFILKSEESAKRIFCPVFLSKRKQYLCKNHREK